MKAKIDITCNSMWVKDCCGKQDLDFPIIDCNTRYYPDYSAICNIVFLSNFHPNYGYVESNTEPIKLAESNILQGSSETDIKQKVKDWYNDNVVDAMSRALFVLKGE